MQVSIIIPFYNAENTIQKTILSAIHQQGIDRMEIICVNDGSTDEGHAVIENIQAQYPHFPIYLIHQTNQGVASARNVGMKMAKGEYIAFLDADDVWHSEKTKIQLQKMREFHLDFLACRRHPQKLLFPYKVNAKGYAPVSFRQMLFRNEIQPSTVIFKKKILEKTGDFVEGQRHAEDHYLWLMISRFFTMGIWDENLITAGGGKKSFGASGLSADLSAMAKGFQQNLQHLEEQKIISKVERFFYSLLYQMKYLFLRFRNKTNI